MQREMRSGRSLRRRPSSREPFRSYLIVCEGRVTEKCYFSDLRILGKIPIRLEFIAGAPPKTLVEWAVERKRESDRLAAKERDEYQRYDEIWAVFDVDIHPKVSEAKLQASANGIELAVSNPCFELWALLHYQDQFAYVSCEELRRLCRAHIPGYEKKLPCADMMPLYPDALRRALQLRKLHEECGTVGANPSTDVFNLVGSIRSQRKDWNTTVPGRSEVIRRR